MYISYHQCPNFPPTPSLLYGRCFFSLTPSCFFQALYLLYKFYFFVLLYKYWEVIILFLNLFSASSSYQVIISNYHCHSDPFFIPTAFFSSTWCTNTINLLQSGKEFFKGPELQIAQGTGHLPWMRPTPVQPPASHMVPGAPAGVDSWIRDRKNPDCGRV